MLKGFNVKLSNKNVQMFQFYASKQQTVTPSENFNPGGCYLSTRIIYPEQIRKIVLNTNIYGQIMISDTQANTIVKNISVTAFGAVHVERLEKLGHM